MRYVVALFLTATMICGILPSSPGFAKPAPGPSLFSLLIAFDTARAEALSVAQTALEADETSRGKYMGAYIGASSTINGLFEALDSAVATRNFDEQAFRDAAQRASTKIETLRTVTQGVMPVFAAQLSSRQLAALHLDKKTGSALLSLKSAEMKLASVKKNQDLLYDKWQTTVAMNETLGTSRGRDAASAAQKQYSAAAVKTTAASGEVKQVAVAFLSIFSLIVKTLGEITHSASGIKADIVAITSDPAKAHEAGGALATHKWLLWPDIVAKYSGVPLRQAPRPALSARPPTSISTAPPAAPLPGVSATP